MNAKLINKLSNSELNRTLFFAKLTQRSQIYGLRYVFLQLLQKHSSIKLVSRNQKWLQKNIHQLQDSENITFSKSGLAEDEK